MTNVAYHHKNHSNMDYPLLSQIEAPNCNDLLTDVSVVFPDPIFPATAICIS